MQGTALDHQLRADKKGSAQLSFPEVICPQLHYWYQQAAYSLLWEQGCLWDAQPWYFYVLFDLSNFPAKPACLL